MSMDSLLDRILSIWARVSVTVNRELVDSSFVHRQGLRPTGLNRVVLPVALVRDKISRELREHRQHVMFQRYQIQHQVHYGPTGRGYDPLSKMSRSEMVHRYENQQSRLRLLHDRYGSLLSYQDGDSFLDLGCGTGQNIRWLAGAFPQSCLCGVDTNRAALDLVRTVSSSEDIVLVERDLSEAESTNWLASKQYDHIIFSHSFSLMIGQSRYETRQMRSRLLEATKMAATKSIVILDDMSFETAPTIQPEQRTRGVVTEDLFVYFDGEQNWSVCMVPYEAGRALVATKNRN